MAAQASERDSIEAIAFAFRYLAQDQSAQAPPPVARFLGRLEAANGGPVSRAEFYGRVERGLRRLQAEARTPAQVRELAILVLCDVEQRSHKTILGTLALSRSQLYRDLRSARLAVARFVERPPERAVAALAAGASFDAFGLALTHAQGLEQNGDWRAAADLLARLAHDLRDAQRRGSVELRLARVYAEAQEFARARERLDIARELAHRAGDDAPWRGAEFDVAQARFLEATGASGEAGRLARRSSAVLRAMLRESATERVRDALVDALTLEAEVALGRGEFEHGRHCAAQATQIAADYGDLDPQRAIAAQAAGAMANLLAGHDPRRTQLDLEQSYALALRCGLTREAIVVATHRAGYLRLMRRSHEEVELLTPLLATARIVGTGGILAAFLSEIIAANVDCGAHADAAAYVHELRECARGNVHMQAVADFTSAKIHLAARDFRSALAASADALAGFSRIGKPRLAGTILLLESKALAGLGQSERAEATLRISIEHLNGRGHPTRRAEAYRLLGTLSGKAEHHGTARKILRAAALPDH